MTRLLLCCGLAALLAFASGVAAEAGQRNGLAGSTSGAFGPKQGGTYRASRTIQGNNAQSSFAGSGPRGRSVSGSAQSTVGAGRASGSATVTTGAGRSATAQGSGYRTATGVTGSGTVATSGGRSLGASGSADRTATGVSATGTVTTGSGRSATGAIDGNRQSGTVTVETAQGSRSREYGTK